MRSDAEIREFLTQWLMEWGSEWVDNIYADGWYIHQNISRAECGVVEYIDRLCVATGSRSKFKLNQAALDFIRGEQE